MYTLFTNPSKMDARVSLPSSYGYVKRGLRKNLAMVLRECRGASYAVDSAHVLVKLLMGLNVDPTLPIFEYHRKVESRAERIARANGITTPGMSGKTFTRDTFYGNNVQEVLLSVSQDIDLLSVEDSWQRLMSIKVLRHPFTGMTFEPLDGRQYTEFPTWAVIQVDLPKLAIQYRQWYLAQKRAGVDFIRTPMQFVFEFPLANAIVSHVDVALFNRLSAVAAGHKTEAFYNTWPMHLSDYDRKVDAYLTDRVAHLTQRPMVFDDMMQQVQLVALNNLQNLSTIPEVAITRQNSWAMTLWVLPIIEFLVQTDMAAGSSRNTQGASVLRKRYRELSRDRDFQTALGADKAQEILDRIDRAVMAYL